MRIVPAMQPIINVCTEQVMGYEILARWWDGTNIYRPADVNLPWHEIDRLMLGEMLSHVGAMNLNSECIFLNVSADTMCCDRLWYAWLAKLNQLVIAANYQIIIEVVETVDDEFLAKRWTDITSLGLKIALDDFGQCNSTIDRLFSFPWSYCKLEAASINSLIGQQAIEYCKRRKIHLIAEKVESAWESREAAHNGIEHQQGFHHGMPFLITETLAVRSA